MSNRNARAVTAGGAVLLACAALWAGTHWSTVTAILSPKPSVANAAASTDAGKVHVSVVTAAEGDIDKIIAGIGVVAPLRTVTIQSRVDGEVTALPFSEGDIVHQGDILAQVDPRQFQAAFAGAQAKQAQDQASLDSARSDADRYSALAKKDIISAEALDQKTSTVHQLEAAIKSDQAAVASAQAQLGFATIRAPFTGRTGFRSVDLGGMVNSGSTTGIVTITQFDPIGVVFVAPGDRFGEIRQAMKDNIATVEALSTDTQTVLATGKLTLMDNNVDAANGSIKLRATFDNSDGKLWPGLPVATRLTVAVRHGTVVPDAVLSRGVDGLYAYVVDAQGKARRQVVDVDVSTDGRSLVTKGLAAGDRIVSQGREQVGDGTMVAVAPDAGNAPDAPKADGAAPKAATTVATDVAP
ncbi:efflux RND transporter periplasmic adaptor subunit [Mesorhizobium sp. PAMC28654]|uniref:efflux RND transporter periplasmic adaptor subunit n=1 Tax=Mesorhizobium sp. PAMC28654 TaxID=2880934 RepID=UPI001D0B772E|nr:efflux RND transporter periplasmic adaptor subunit [Mesorhizobium sp. PAMC28654]UDL89126.1 efflux RND transporter periplasmic adaptor subunit [Mesorhizobium sp. PAMC28654]